MSRSSVRTRNCFDPNSSGWDVETDVGRILFSVKDTFRSLLSLAGGRVFITDVDGGRYEIPDASLLDKASYRKIELYL